MYARATVALGDASQVDAAIALVRDQVLPLQADQPGGHGLTMSVDRAQGRCTVTSMWADRASMHASELAMSPLRDVVGRVLGAAPATEEYELVVLHRPEPAESGNWVRSTAVQLDPPQVAAGIAAFQRSTLPEVEALPGFRSATLMVDRRSGVGIVSVVFDDRAQLEASRADAARVRRTSSDRTGAQVTRVVEGEIVVAALRLPVTDRAPVA